MKTKWILSAIGAMAFSQIVGAQSVFTSVSSDDNFAGAMAALSPDISISSDDSSADMALTDATQASAPAPVTRDYSTTAKSKWNTSSDSSADFAADGSWLTFGIAAAPDLAAFDNNTVSFTTLMPSEDVAVQTPSNGAVEVASAGVSAAAHDPLVVVPEPGTFGLLMLGGSAFVRFFRRK